MTNKIPQEIEEKITIIVSPQANMSKREIEDTILYNKGFQKGFKAGQLQKQDECLKRKNPYPEDIFTPLSKEEIKRYVKLLVDNGFSSDKIHAHWMRFSWELCAEELQRLLE
jgi:hypothetical protein